MIFLWGAIISAALAFAMASGIRRLGLKFGAIDFGRNDQNGTILVARTGGVMVALSTCCTLALLVLFNPDVFPHNYLFSPSTAGLVSGALFILIIGLIDDAQGLRARWKLVGQVAAAIISWWLGLRVEVVTNLLDPADPIVLGVWSLPIWVVWVVLCTNAMNITDGIDCLAGGIFSLGMLFFLANCIINDFTAMSAIASALLGSVGAFLYYNYQKKMYLGDSGSLLLGFILAAIVPLSSPKSSGLGAVLIPLGVLSVPIAELLVTTLRRLLLGKPIGRADDGHLHYRLIQLGLTARRTAFIINLFCCFGGVLALSMTLSFKPQLALILGGCWIALVLVMFRLSYKPSHGKAAKNHEYRNTMFLDVERVLQRNISSLRSVAVHEEMLEILKRILAFIDADSIQISIYDQDQQLLFSLDTAESVGNESHEPSDSMVMNLKGVNGIHGSIKMRFANYTHDLDLNKASFWVYQVWSSISRNYEYLESRSENGPRQVRISQVK